MFRLIEEGGVFLIAFGGEADVVELNFVGAGLGYEFGQRDVVFLHLGLRRIGPDQLAVFAPGLPGLSRLHGEFGMLHHQPFVAEDGDARDGMHVLGVQEVNKLWQVMNVDLMFAEQRMFEGNIHAAIGILNVENDGVAANLAPVANDAHAMVAGGHDTGEVDGAHFKIFGHGNGLFDDGLGKDAGDRDLLAGFQDVAGAVSVNVPDRLREFRGREIRGAFQILARNGGNGLATLRAVDLSTGRGGLQRRDCGLLFGGTRRARGLQSRGRCGLRALGLCKLLLRRRRRRKSRTHPHGGEAKH